MKAHPNGGGMVASTAYVDDTVFVGPYATVYENAIITGNVKINGYAKVHGNAQLKDNVVVQGDCEIYGRAILQNNARVSGNAKVFGEARLYDNAQVFDDSFVYGKAVIRNESEVYDNAQIAGNAMLWEYMKIYGDSIVTRKPIIVNIPECDTVITITDHHMSAGCITLPPSLWKAHGELILRYFGFKREWNPLLIKAAELHGCQDREEDLERYRQDDIVRKILSGYTQDRIMHFEKAFT